MFTRAHPVEQRQETVEERPAPVVSAQSPVVNTQGRAKLAAVGFLAALVGAWGALVAYIGPQLDLHLGNDRSWQWTTNHAMLNLLPGGVAVVAGLLMIMAAPGAL